MKLKELLKEIKDVFKPPKKRYYFGKVAHGTPYSYPRNFLSTIVSVRKLKLKSEEERAKYAEKYPHLKDRDVNKFSNLPMVRRSKEWIKKVFGNYYLIQIGSPIWVKYVELGWKWKYEDIRYEWSPQFHIFFFRLQFCIFWNAPDGDNDKYYEQILWWLHCDKNLETAKSGWGWVDIETKKSTWNDNYLEWEYRDIELW